MQFGVLSSDVRSSSSPLAIAVTSSSQLGSQPDCRHTLCRNRAGGVQAPLGSAQKRSPTNPTMHLSLNLTVTAGFKRA